MRNEFVGGFSVTDNHLHRLWRGLSNVGAGRRQESRIVIQVAARECRYLRYEIVRSGSPRTPRRSVVTHLDSEIGDNEKCAK